MPSSAAISRTVSRLGSIRMTPNSRSVRCSPGRVMRATAERCDGGTERCTLASHGSGASQGWCSSTSRVWGPSEATAIVSGELGAYEALGLSQPPPGAVEIPVMEADPDQLEQGEGSGVGDGNDIVVEDGHQLGTGALA